MGAVPYPLCLTPPSDREGPGITRRSIKLIVLIALSVAVLIGIVWVVGADDTLAAVGQAGVGAFAGVGLTMVASVALRATAWAALNRPVKHKVPFRTLLGAELVGTAGNIMTPSTYLGGEPFKVMYVGRATGHPYHEVAGTVLLAKYIEALSFILFFSMSAFVAAVGFRALLFGPYLAAGITLLVVAAALLVLSGVLWLSLSRRWRPVTRLARILVSLRVCRRFFSRLAVRARSMEEQVARVFCEEGQAARVAFLALLGSHVVIFFRPAVFFLLGRAHITLWPAQLCLLFVVSQALLCFQLTPSGVGTLDGGLIGAFALLGLPETQCMAFLLCLRFWDVLLIGSGMWLAGRAGTHILTGAEEAPELIEPQADEAAERPQP